ncbi:hypothetical protein [Phenylobacterium sp.]|uniref:hypothetical protein n=1 Tax=Phenylobacterium sp. TaxID=1871053 RepID=UPI002FC91D2D
MIFATNIFFTLAHISTVLLAKSVPGISWIGNDVLRLDRDRSVAEFYNYLQALITVVLLARAFVLSRQGVFLAWALIFAFIVLDDAMLIHERVGGLLAAKLALPALPGLRLRDVGELIVWGVAAALLLPVLIWGFRSSTRQAAGYGVLLTFIFAVLVFFGAGMDMVHIVVAPWSRLAGAALAVAEDGGEMLALALACSYALLLDHRLSTRPVAITPDAIHHDRDPASQPD